MWTRHATRAIFLLFPYWDSVSMSRAAASPAKSAIFPGAIPSTHHAVSALEEQRSEKYRHALIAVVSISVRAGQLDGTDAWLSSHLVSHA